jgi:hypothetical protein
MTKSLLGGGLEPHFRVLFSAIFQDLSWGISIRVENDGGGWKQKFYYDRRDAECAAK